MRDEEEAHAPAGVRRPLVTVAIPVRNGGVYVREAIESVLGQTFRDFELILSDNASTDGTAEVCARYAERDPRVRFQRNADNIGAAANFNRCFELARGRYFKWLAADEAIEPDFLDRCVRVLESDPEVVAATSQYISRNEFDGTTIRPDWDYDLGQRDPLDRLRKLFWTTPNMIFPIWGLIRSDVLRSTHLIRPFVGSDACLVVELVLSGPSRQVPGFLHLLRSHPGAFHSMKFRTRGVEGAREARWFDPSNRGLVVLPHWRQIWEFGRSIVAMPWSVAERLRLLVTFQVPLLSLWKGYLAVEVFSAVRLGWLYRLLRHGPGAVVGTVTVRSRARPSPS